MPQICYVDKRFNSDAREVIYRANEICGALKADSFDITLRQLYYEFVARDVFPDARTWSWTGSKWVRDPSGTKNAEPNYKWLGGIVNDARMAGLIDWDYIVDRTRELEGPGSQYAPHWDDPEQIIRGAARGYNIDKWQKQSNHVEVWIEKDALKGALATACPDLDVAYFSCRGYTSQSEMWGAAQRLGGAIKDGHDVRIIHLGDHDPSGIDMTRDISERLATFIASDVLDVDPDEGADVCLYELGERFEVDRIALNMDQVRDFNPPPNPAKLTDARAVGYVQRYGYESWELDALGPRRLVGLVREAVETRRDDVAWDAAVKREESERVALTRTAERWSDVEAFVMDETS